MARAVRERARLRQADVGRLAGVSQSCVSLVENGQLDDMTVGTLRCVVGAHGVRLPFAPQWRGGELARLLDRDHAALVEQVVRLLRDQGFTAVVEWTFNHYGDRGSVDVIAWHAQRAALLVVEVKSRLVDVQDLLSRLDVKVRIAPRALGRERGWHPLMVGRLVVAAGSRANRGVVARHDSTFSTALPGRALDVRRWLRDPRGELAAIWFLAPATSGHGRRDAGKVRRVRSPQIGGPQTLPRRPRQRDPTDGEQAAVSLPRSG